MYHVTHVCVYNFSTDWYLEFVQNKQQENLTLSIDECKAALWVFLSRSSKQDNV